MVRDAIIVATGVFAWTIVEYIIHGTLAHAHRTFVTKMHGVHHGDPSRVFALRAWPWIAIVYFGGLAWVGFSSAMIFLSGIVIGFALYEIMHYRFHYAVPANSLEAHLRARHLAHHIAAPKAYFGVTTSLWDKVLGSEPEPARRAELEAAAARIAPLAGRSNLERITGLWN
jgi:sterol desaturase/sphingolipid hydroxylase (fatty acid hydroxylase superfamily)